MASAAGSALSLIKAMLEIIADRRSGVLDVRFDGARTQISFDDGKPVFAEDDAPGESFGRLLMRQAVITNDQFVRVIDEMTRAAAGNNQLRFGEVAVGLGVLTTEQVERGLAEQVCAIITRSLQRGESQWTFEPSPAAARPARSFSLEINPAVLAGLRQPAGSSASASDRSLVADAVAARPEELVLVAGPRPASDARAEAGGGVAAETHAARINAELAFQKGMAMLREAKTASAAIELRRASELQPESLEYQLYATWARARSYRETPTEVDQQALVDIAQKAKRRDPLFAFASYVLGQVSMWTGDDATAKKWFYEALRLDPASEAAKQVRVLARRGGEPAAHPTAPAAGQGGGGQAGGQATDNVPPARDQIAAPPPVPVTRPPAPPPAAKPAPPAAKPATPLAKAPAGRWAGRLLAGGALLGIGALVVVAVAKNEPPQAELAPSAVSQPALSADASPPLDSERKDTVAQTGDVAVAEKQAKAMDEKNGQDAQDAAEMGTVLLPPRAAGHRIFVDGRRAKTDGEAPLRLPCGSHVIQIGSSGEPETIDLPCRGEVQLQ